jgi:hypothetical protein
MSTTEYSRNFDIRFPFKHLINYIKPALSIKLPLESDPINDIYILGSQSAAIVELPTGQNGIALLSSSIDPNYNYGKLHILHCK